MAKNENLHNAKMNKNDEFYTRLEDIEAEISSHPDYVRHFQGKTVLCNCDDPEQSNFYEFFRLHFKQLGLRKLITTHYIPPILKTEERVVLDRKGQPKKNKDGSLKTEEVVVETITVSSYKLEWCGEILNDDTVNLIKTPLKGNGDFRSDECIELLKEADIVVTNPPFSLFREYVAQLMQYNKKFVIIGNVNAVTYKEFFPLLRDKLVWAGYSFNKTLLFEVGDGYTYDEKETSKIGDGKYYGKVPSIAWFTNLDIDKRHESIPLTKLYKGNEQSYPYYDNYNAINVDKVKDIPKDYDGVIGVPITFLGDFCQEQFEIVGFGQGDVMYEHGVSQQFVDDYKSSGQKGVVHAGHPFLVYYRPSDRYPVIPYFRILIRKRKVA